MIITLLSSLTGTIWNLVLKGYTRGNKLFSLGAGYTGDIRWGDDTLVMHPTSTECEADLNSQSAGSQCTAPIENMCSVQMRTNEAGNNQRQTWGQFHFVNSNSTQFHLVNSNSTSNLSITIQFQNFQFRLFFCLIFFTMSRYSEYLLGIHTPSSLYSK